MFAPKQHYNTPRSKLDLRDTTMGQDQETSSPHIKNNCAKYEVPWPMHIGDITRTRKYNDNYKVPGP
jgi:hypothetical protein